MKGKRNGYCRYEETYAINVDVAAASSTFKVNACRRVTASIECDMQRIDEFYKSIRSELRM